MGEITDAMRIAYGPNPLGAALDEIELLRKQYQAVTDQRDTLLAVVRELRAEIARLDKGNR